MSSPYTSPSNYAQSPEHPLGVVDLGEYRDDRDESRRQRVLEAVLAATGRSYEEFVIDLTDPQSVAELSPQFFEKDGFVERAPVFLDQVEDESRVMPFRFKQSKGRYDVMTENEGLIQLNQALSTFLALTDKPHFQAGSFTEQAIENLRNEAMSIRDNLTFIGASEYQRATQGIALRWKSYLDQDPDNQLCVVAGVSALERYELDDNQRKSDAWVAEDVLSRFSEEELREKYDGRIFTDASKITADEEHAKVVLVDDWSISGAQLRDCYKELAENAGIHKLVESGCIEINVIAAGGSLIDEGLETHNGPLEQPTVPVYAYFRAKGEKYDSGKGNNLHITGVHSSVNYGFRDSIRSMAKVIRMKEASRRIMDKKFVAITEVDPLYYDSRILSTLHEENGVFLGCKPVQVESKPVGEKRHLVLVGSEHDA